MSKKELYIELHKKLHSDDETLQQEARNAFFDEIAPFIGHIIKTKYSSFLSEYDDLFQEGSVAVLEDLNNYDPERGALTTFFAPRIRNRISNAVTEKVNKTNRYYAKKMKAVKEALQYFESQGLTPSVSDIQIRTGLSMKSVSETLDFIKRVDMSYTSETEPIVPRESTSDDTPEKALLESEKKEVLYDALATLPEKERVIICYRFGLNEEEAHSIAKTAEYTGITEQEVTKLIRHAINFLKKNRELLNFYKGKVDKVEKERNRGKVDFLNTSKNTDIFPEELDENNVDYFEYAM